MGWMASFGCRGPFLSRIHLALSLGGCSLHLQVSSVPQDPVGFSLWGRQLVLRGWRRMRSALPLAGLLLSCAWSSWFPLLRALALVGSTPQFHLISCTQSFILEWSRFHAVVSPRVLHHPWGFLLTSYIFINTPPPFFLNFPPFPHLFSALSPIDSYPINIIILAYS